MHNDYQFQPFEMAKSPLMSPMSDNNTNDSNTAEGSFFSDLDKDEPLNNGGDFFSKFYFDKLVQDMEAA